MNNSQKHLMRQNPKERYNHFQKTYSHIYHRIPLGMVVSYLGITQEILSRISAEK